MRISRILYLILLTGFYGCTTTPPAQMAEDIQPGKQKYPPVSVFWMQPSQEQIKDCAQYIEVSRSPKCSFNSFKNASMSDALRDTHLFESVTLANNQNDYAVVVSTLTYPNGNNSNPAKTLISGASPNKITAESGTTVKSEVTMMWRGLSIATYSYDLPLVDNSAIERDNDLDKQFATRLISRFVTDLQKENIFSGQFLAKALQASDYEKDLILPERISTHFYEDRFIYPDPFLGVMIRYHHLTNSNNFNDIFIYPIRASDWSDETSILETEAANVRKEIELVEKEQYIKAVQCKDNRYVEYPVGETKKTGLMFSCVWINKEEEPTLSFIYLFLSKDKFIKVRGSMAYPGEGYSIENFVKEAIATISVPDEDDFMTKFRQQQSQQAFQNQADR